MVDPQTRQIFANEPDTAGILQPYGSIFSGILPDDVNISNTAKEWSGNKWAMVMLPLSQNKYERIDLLAHELFHRAQPALGLSFNIVENNHLNEKNGRIYLRLELEALKKAMQSLSEEETHRHLTNALTFRKHRNSLFPDTYITENIWELHEGLASFTGLIISGMSTQFTNHINAFFTIPTFVWSFANVTTPVYGYLLYRKNRNWNKEITRTTNLTDFFIEAFAINIPTNVEETVRNISDNYNGKIIIQEETAREEENRRRTAEYKRKFIEQPHLVLRFQQMNISFDPRNLFPLDDKGTVYPNIRVVDLWGILTVEGGGALRSPFWDRITVTSPIRTENNIVIGDGWTLELADEYIIERDEASGNYRLARR